jgi:hypothetical protein
MGINCIACGDVACLPRIMGCGIGGASSCSVAGCLVQHGNILPFNAKLNGSMPTVPVPRISLYVGYRSIKLHSVA